MPFYEKVSELCREKGISISAAALDMGFSNAAATHWKKRGTKPKYETVRRVADYFDVDVSFFDDEVKEAVPAGPMVMIPVIGSVRAGYGSTAIEEYTGDYLPVFSDAMHGSPQEYRVLRASGDSMYPFILDGDFLLIHIQPVADSGDTVIVILENGESTVKKLSDDGERMRLIPTNPMYPPLDIRSGDRIWGKVVRVERVL